MPIKLEDALKKLPPILNKDLEGNLCTCNEVPKINIIQAIADGAITLAEIKNKTYATDGTGCCARQVARLIECIHGEGVIDVESVGGKRRR